MLPSPQIAASEPTNNFESSSPTTGAVNAAVFSIKPRSVTTTVVTTTTTTLTEFPPLYFEPPPKELDSSQFPLSSTPTPPALKKFCFDLNGIPTHFKELDIKKDSPTKNFRKRPFTDDMLKDDFDNNDRMNTLPLSPTLSPTRSVRDDSVSVSVLPGMMRTFESLPQGLKTYLLLQLLRRSPVETLQFVAGLVLPVLKRDFMAHLPLELSLQILAYLDLRSLGRVCCVSWSWRAVVESPGAQLGVWKKRVAQEGWLESGDGDYKAQYQRHHQIRLNWFHGKYRHISFPGHGYNVVTCLQFDEDKIVSGSDDQTIHIYDTSTGALRRKLIGHEGGVWALQYWNNTLVSGSTDRTVRVWDMESGRCTHRFEGHTSTVRCLLIITPALNPETQQMEPAQPLIVTGSRDSTLRVWKLPEGDDTSEDCFKHVLNGHSNSVRAIAGHGNVLVSGSYDHTVRVWDLQKGVCSFVFRGHSEKVYSVGYSHQLHRAASGSMDATVRVWCTRTGEALFALKDGHNSLVGLLEFSSKYLVSAAADATLRVWSPTTGKCLATLTGHSAAITCFHHDPKYNRIVSGSDGGVKVWELSSGGYGSEIGPLTTAAGPGFAFTQGPSGPEPVHGRFIGDVIKGVQGVWRTRMDERRLVCAVQREGGRTWFEVLDFDEINNNNNNERIIVNPPVDHETEDEEEEEEEEDAEV